MLDFIKSIQSDVIFNLKWTINDAEEMDIFAYLDILAYKINSSDYENVKSQEKEVYIDDIPWL